MDAWGIANDPAPHGATATPTTAGAPKADTAPGSPADAPKGTLVIPPGTPFYLAATSAAAAGYASMAYPDPVTGGYVSYDVTPTALAAYARNAGNQAAMFQARALAPAPESQANMGASIASLPVMGGNVSSLVSPGRMQTSPVTASGSATPWSTALLHVGPVGGITPIGATAGGPEKGTPA